MSVSKQQTILWLNTYLPEDRHITTNDLEKEDDPTTAINHLIKILAEDGFKDEEITRLVLGAKLPAKKGVISGKSEP